MIERRFENWDYQTSQQIEECCLELPVLPRSQAMAFFKQAEVILKQDVKLIERPSGRVFESLGGFILSSDRQDFTVTTDFSAESSLHGLLMLETFDSVLGILFCVARVAESVFLTHGFTQRQKAAIMDLRNIAPASLSDPSLDTSAGELSEMTVDPLCMAALDLNATKEAREAAWKMLEEQGNIVLGFIAGLKHKDLAIRRAMVVNLGYVNDARAVEPLIEALKNKDEHIRWGAAESLGKLSQFSDERVVAGLSAVLADEDHLVRKAAAEALKLIGAR